MAEAPQPPAPTPPSDSGSTPPTPPTPPADPAPAPAPPGEPLPPSLTQDPTQPKPPGEPPPGDPKPPEGETKPPGETKGAAPEKYDFSSLKLPNGVELHADIVGAIEPVFKKHGLTQEAANELVTAHAEAVAKLQTAAEQKAETDFNEWMGQQARENDRAIRKDWGTDYDQNFQTAQRALARFFKDEAFYKVLDETGLVRHPAFMRGLHQIGKMIQEDTPPNGGNPGGRKSDAEIFYGNSH